MTPRRIQTNTHQNTEALVADHKKIRKYENGKAITVKPIMTSPFKFNKEAMLADRKIQAYIKTPTHKNTSQNINVHGDDSPHQKTGGGAKCAIRRDRNYAKLGYCAILCEKYAFFEPRTGLGKNPGRREQTEGF